jgi:hypothetical protein
MMFKSNLLFEKRLRSRPVPFSFGCRLCGVNSQPHFVGAGRFAVSCRFTGRECHVDSLVDLLVTFLLALFAPSAALKAATLLKAR